MYYVYLLKLENKKNQFYIGYTGNLQRRIREHVQGKVRTTNRLSMPKLVYYESYLESDLAIERERQLKRFGSAYYALLKRLGYK